jgi:hypothetical protein
MKVDLRCVKVVILVGCLVVLGLHTAAQGLEKMSPDISSGFFKISSENRLVTVTALGREYYFDAGNAVCKMELLMAKGEDLGKRWKQQSVFWGNLVLEKSRAFFPRLEEWFQFLRTEHARNSDEPVPKGLEQAKFSLSKEN